MHQVHSENQNKQVLILGGTCKLAIETAKLLSQKYHLTLTYRDESKKKAVEKELSCSVGWLFFDFSAPMQNISWDYVIDFAHIELEKLFGKFLEQEIQDYWQKMVIQRQLLLQQIANSMLQQRFGRFLFISSTATVLQNPGQSIYAASKNAIESLYKSIGVEYGKKNITSISLRLGYVDVGRGKDFTAENKALIKRIPTRKWIQAQDVAHTILFLIQPSSMMFNATSLIMDGGLTATK